MNRVLNIWGRDFEIEIVYDCYRGEEVTSFQEIALNAFLSKAGDLINNSLDAVKKYCLNRDREKFGAESIDNIFKYVKPKKIYIDRCEFARIVALMCNYKFNEDDGLAVVFKNEELKEVGSQNIIL